MKSKTLFEMCEYDNCKQPAKWALFKTYLNEQKKWLHVCNAHEQNIGAENLVRAGGYYKKEERKC